MTTVLDQELNELLRERYLLDDPSVDDVEDRLEFTDVGETHTYIRCPFMACTDCEYTLAETHDLPNDEADLMKVAMAAHILATHA